MKKHQKRWTPSEKLEIINYYETLALNQFIENTPLQAMFISHAKSSRNR